MELNGSSSWRAVDEHIAIPERVDLDEQVDVFALIVKLSKEYGVDTKTALRIAKCESGFRAEARNPNSTATGVYQWLSGTWSHIGNPGDRLNAEDSIRQFMIYYPNHPGWWDECK